MTASAPTPSQSNGPSPTRASSPVPSLPAPGRAGALLAASALPLWVACSLLLYTALGTPTSGTPSTGAPSPGELHAQYLAGGAPMWAFAYLSVIATEVMAISAVLVALATARLTGRPLLPVVTIVVATAGALAGLWNTIALVVFLASRPGSLPAWSLPADDTAGDTLNIVTWALLSLAVALVSACLWRAGVLPRLGPTVGVLAVLAVPLGPVPTALLLTVLGVTLSGLSARIRTLWNPGPRTEGSPA